MSSARIAAAGILAHTLREMDPAFPTTDPAARDELLAMRAQLVAEDATGEAAAEAVDASIKGKPSKSKAKAKAKGKGSKGG